MTYVLKGRMIDGIQDTALENGCVAIQGNRIVYAGPDHEYTPPEDATVLDCAGGTILPGFIDVHAHLTGHEDAGSYAGGQLFGDQLIGAVHELTLLLEAGFTGLRDMSLAGLYLSRGVERGAIPGPRIVPGGRVIGMTSGHVDMHPEWTREEINRLDPLSYLCDGPDDCVRAVREQFRMGAKFIKICATGGVSSPTDRIDDVQFSPEELRAMVQEARRHHSYVTAHCTGYEGAYQALLAGVECIEHGVMLTEREVALMAEKHVPLVSTLWVSLNVANLPGMPAFAREKARTCAEYNRKTIALCRQYGVPVALGTDFSNSRNTSYLTIGREFEAMVEGGLTPMEAIRGGTSIAASVMRMNDLGVLKEGCLADITVTDGNPLENISCLADAQHIPLVIADGKIVKNRLSTSAAEGGHP